MKFGYFNIFSRCPEEEPHEAFQRSVAEVVQAEKLGFDDVWVAETPMFDPITVGNLSLVTAAYLCGRTSRMRIGTGIVSMPMRHPLQVAINAATIDHLSGGRFDLGIGRGIATNLGPHGFPALGSRILPPPPPDRYRKQYLESIDCIKGLLNSECFNYEGEFYHFDNTALNPRPYQAPLPMWVVAASRETFPEMGTKGINLLIPWPGWQGGIGTWEETSEMLGAYRQAWAKEGHAGTPQVTVRVPTFIQDTTEKAREVARRVLGLFRTRFPQQVPQTGLSQVTSQAHASNALGTSGLRELMTSTVPVDDLIDKITITGDPKFAIDQIQRIEDDLGATGVMLECQFLGQTEPADHMQTLELTAELVMPRFK